jgi:HD-like signal output (HDOD) protein
LVATPRSIERLEPFPDIAVTILHRIPSPIAQMSDFSDLLAQQPQMLEEISQVAMQSGRAADGQPLDAQSVFATFAPEEITDVAITLLVRGYMRRAFSVSEDRRYWRYTLACAVCCEQVAVMGNQVSLLAYASGLLHDIGRLALIATYPDRYSNLLSLTDRMFAAGEQFNILEHERLLFGMDHFATGEWVAAAWKLPPWLRPIVGKFGAQGTGEFTKLVATVRAGTALAHSLGFGYLQGAPRSDIRKILGHLPEAWKQWKVLDQWKYGEAHMREKIQSRLNWYGVPPLPEAR